MPFSDLSLEDLTDRLTVKARRKATLKRGLGVTAQVLEALLDQYTDCQVVLYDLDLRYVWCGGYGWAKDPADLIGKDPVAVFGPLRGEAASDHYRIALVEEHWWDCRVDGNHWRNRARPVELSGETVGAVLVSWPARSPCNHCEARGSG